MAFDCYLKIPTVDGEATHKGHEKWIELLSYNQGVSQHSGGSMSSAGGLSGGRANFQDFTIVHPLDKSSPKLNAACASGEHIKDITLEICRSTGDAKGTVFMKYVMSDVLVSSVKTGGSAKGAEPLPLEEVAFAFGKIEWTYTETDHAGKKKGDIKTGWDVSKNAKV